MKFLLKSIVFFILCLFVLNFFFPGPKVDILYGDYTISCSVTDLSLMSAVILFSLILFFKIIGLLLNIPFAIKASLEEKRNIDSFLSMFEILFYSMSGRKKDALGIAEKIEKRVKKEFLNLFYLIKSEATENFIRKAESLVKVKDSGEYDYFSSKRLAEVFFQNDLYKDAERFAAEAFGIYEKDPDIITILIFSYAKLGLWEKFEFMLSKLKKYDEKRFEEISYKISRLYAKSAEESISLGNREAALEFVNKALEYNPSDRAALGLHLKLETKKEKSVEKIKKAFALNPSFDLAKIYSDYFGFAPGKVYSDLSVLASKEKYMDVFLALASYLGLSEEIAAFKI